VRKSASVDAPIVLGVDAITYSVRAMPAVGSQPLGRAQAPAAGASELAWVDHAPERRVLPEGIVFDQSEPQTGQYSVASVSGSFLEPLPDNLSDAATMSDTAVQLAAEFRAAFQAWGGNSHAAETVSQVPINLQGQPQSRWSVTDASDDASGVNQIASTPARLAFGMVASLSAVGAAATPSRRRGNNWIQHAFSWIGLD
jgi:hypothetical protein